MSIYDVLGSAFGIGDTALNSADMVPVLMEHPSQQINMDTKQGHLTIHLYVWWLGWGKFILIGTERT